MEQAIPRRLARRIEDYQVGVTPLFGRQETQRWAREYVAGLMRTAPAFDTPPSRV